MTRIITPADWVAQPWKNGRGVTHEIARWPSCAGDGDYDVRVSLAEVTASGPFSTFPGYVRWTVLVDDAHIGLEVGGTTHWLVRGEPLRVDGDAPIVAHVESPGHLLNVIARPDRIEVGTGPASNVDFAFAMSATTTLDRWHAATECASITGDTVWLRSSPLPEDR